MQILVTIDGAKLATAGVWSASVEPANVRQIGSPASAVGETTVILLDDPAYNPDANQVSFPLNGARVLNLGSSDCAIFVSANSADDWHASDKETSKAELVSSTHAAPDLRLGLGDRQLLTMTKSFPPEMADAALKVVSYVRSLDPNGDFTKHRNRFVNRRDNFVAIEPQTRKQQLLINVRGIVSTTLQTLSTFNGYTAFKLGAPRDLDAVLSAIGSATRKPH